MMNHIMDKTIILSLNNLLILLVMLATQLYFSKYCLVQRSNSFFIDAKEEELIEDKAVVETARELFGVNIKH